MQRQSSIRFLTHFWEHTGGSSDATVVLRADWQKQSTRGNREPNFANAGKTRTDIGNLAATEVSSLELSAALLMELFATRQKKGSVFGELTANKTLHKWNL